MENLVENEEFLNFLTKKLINYPKNMVKSMLSKFLKSNPQHVEALKNNINDADVLKQFINYIKKKRTSSEKNDISKVNKIDVDDEFRKNEIERTLERVKNIQDIKADKEIYNKKIKRQIELDKKMGLDTVELETLLKETEVNLDQFNLKNKLNEKFWTNDKLNPIVRIGLLKVAKKFILDLGLDNTKLHDIVFTGSLANKNYTNNSDVDLHIIMDYVDISDNPDLVMDYFKTKKNEWSDKYDITIFGYPVEIFVQDNDQKREWASEYSVLDDKWINKPNLTTNTIDRQTIKTKSEDIINKVDKLEKSINDDNQEEIIDELNELVEKIKKMRKSGLEGDGEMSNENLIFKVLRNSGTLDKIQKIKNKLIGKELTIMEIFD